MRNIKVKKVFMIFLLIFLFWTKDNVLAQTLKTSYAGKVRQVFALTTSDEAIYTNSSGEFEPMPSTSLTIKLKRKSLLIITFAAQGTVQTVDEDILPEVFIKCEIDGTPCQPNSDPVKFFLFPYPFCCDTRSFTWVVHDASKGTHTITIYWGMGNPTPFIVTNRTLIVEAAEQ